MDRCNKWKIRNVYLFRRNSKSNIQSASISFPVLPTWINNSAANVIKLSTRSHFKMQILGPNNLHCLMNQLIFMVQICHSCNSSCAGPSWFRHRPQTTYWFKRLKYHLIPSDLMYGSESYINNYAYYWQHLFLPIYLSIYLSIYLPIYLSISFLW